MTNPKRRSFLGLFVSWLFVRFSGNEIMPRHFSNSNHPSNIETNSIHNAYEWRENMCFGMVKAGCIKVIINCYNQIQIVIIVMSYFFGNIKIGGGD